MNVIDMITDYLKFKNITIIGIVLYPLIAPLAILFLGFAYIKTILRK